MSEGDKTLCTSSEELGPRRLPRLSTHLVIFGSVRSHDFLGDFMTPSAQCLLASGRPSPMCHEGAGGSTSLKVESKGNGGLVDMNFRRDMRVARVPVTATESQPLQTLESNMSEF